MPSTNSHGPKRAILYARVSTDEQARSGYSLAQQMEALRQYAAREGYEVLEEVSDPGRSGAYLEKPGLDRARDLVEGGGVAVVLAQDADRITRDPGHRAFLDNEAERFGARWAALDDWGDDSHEGELLKYLKGWVSKGERLKTAERFRRGRQGKARKGEMIASHKVAYGFRGLKNEEGRTYAYTVHVEQMDVARRIFRMVGVEGYTLRAVKKNLEAAGIPAPGGGRYWSQSYLRGLILNDTYKPHTHEELREILSPEVLRGLGEGASEAHGVMYYGQQEVTRTPSRENASGYSYKTTPRDRQEWTAVPVPDSTIPREWIEAAREAIKDNRRPSACSGRFWELSGGIVRCSGCSRVLQTTAIAGRNGKVHHYDRCPTRVQHGKEACPGGGYHRADELELRIWELVRSLLADPEKLAVGLDVLIEEQRGRMRGSPDEEATAWTRKLEECAERRGQRLHQHEQGHITDAELGEALDTIAGERRVAESELAKLRNLRAEVADLEEDKQALLDSYAAIMPEALDALTPEERHKTYRMLRLAVVARPGGELEVSGVLQAVVSNPDSTLEHGGTLSGPRRS
jgi:site-specific DNA recombinase